MLWLLVTPDQLLRLLFGFLLCLCQLSLTLCFSLLLCHFGQALFLSLLLRQFCLAFLFGLLLGHFSQTFLFSLLLGYFGQTLLFSLLLRQFSLTFFFRLLLSHFGQTLLFSLLLIHRRPNKFGLHHRNRVIARRRHWQGLLVTSNQLLWLLLWGCSCRLGRPSSLRLYINQLWFRLRLDLGMRLCIRPGLDISWQWCTGWQLQLKRLLWTVLCQIGA